MNHINPTEHARPGGFGHRKVMPRACVTDGKKHLRTFLSDALEDLGFITSECGQASELAGSSGRATAGSGRPRRVFRRDRGRQNSRDPGHEELPRQGSRDRPAGVDHGKGRPANWRGIRHRHAALACRRLSAPGRCVTVLRRCCPRTGAEPRGGCGRGAEGRLARIVVSAEDQCAHPGSQRRRGTGADAASRLGCGSAGLFHSRRQGSAFSRPVRVRDRPRDRGLALSARAAGAGRSLDQPAGFVSPAIGTRCAICAARCPIIPRSAAC